MKFFHMLAYKIKTPPEGMSASDVRGYVMNNYIFTFALCGHALFIPVFYILGNEFSFYNNIACTGIDALSLYLNSKGKMRAVYIIFPSSVAYHTMACHFSFGPDAGFIYYFFSLTVFFFIYRRFRYLRFVMFFCILTLFIAQYILMKNNPVSYPATPIPEWVIYYLNAFANFFVIGFMTTYFSVAADRAEEMLITARDRAEEGRRVKSLFLASMSHEIRTPLNSVAGMISLSLLSESENERRKFLHIAKDSADHLLTVINDILDFSKIEENKMVLHCENFDIFNLVNNTVKAMSPGIDKEKLTISSSVAEDIPRVLKGDTSRIRQVLINLLSNAIKFTREGSIKVDVAKKSSSGDSCLISFTVSDTGIGISEERQDTIFDSFIQLEESGIVKRKGAGLGLSISRELIRLMGGTISVESKPGEGSSFTFEISLPEGEVKEGLAETPFGGIVPEARSGIKVLVAEDDVINRMLIEQYLGMMKCGFKIVENGKMVLEELEKSGYDLILMDIEMPDMDGIEAVNLIRNSGRDDVKDIPVIAMTGYAVNDYNEMGMGRGFSGFLSKPFSYRDLEGSIVENIPLKETDETSV